MRDVLVRLELLAAWLKPGGPYPSEPIPDKYSTLVEAVGEIERLRRRVVALEMVIREELPPLSCACDANRMLVEGIHAVVGGPRE